MVASALSSLVSRTRAWPAVRVDAALAALVMLATAVETGFADAPAGARAAALGCGVIAAGAVLIRRRDALAAQVLAVAAVASTGLLADDEVRNALNAVYLVLLLCTYFMAARETGARLAAGVAVAVGGVLVIALALSDFNEEASAAADLAIAAAFFLVAPVIAGRVLHSRLRLSAALGEKAERIEATRAGRAREAAHAERTRIAGELHDLVAHALGAMTIQAAGARRLANVKPALAAEAFEAIEVTGRDALGELRTLLDALKEDDQEPELMVGPQPTLTALPELAGRARTAGLAVELGVDGSRPDGIPAGVDVTAYRIVQDALTSALHQGGAESAQVRVRYRGDRLEVEVVDDGLRVSERRLLGLRERVGLYRGEVEIGAERAGGHAVRAWLPLEGVPA